MDLSQIVAIFNKEKLTRITVRDGEKEVTLEKEHPPVAPVYQAHGEYYEEETPMTEIGDLLLENVIKAPMVGILYRAPSPEAEPYVEEGDLVKRGDVLGIIEAMKVMNEVKAERDGTVKEIKVEDGQAVEFGMPLFVIE